MIYQLEDRVLFDGALAADVNAVQQDQDDAAEQLTPESTDGQQPQQNRESTGAETHELAPVLPVPDAGDGASAEAPSAADPVEVIVISEKLWNANELAEATRPGTIVVTFDPKATSAADLLAEITGALDGQTADRIAFLTGEAAKNTEFYTANDAFWAGLAPLLDADGEIDLFASNLASDTEGQAAADHIGDLAEHTVHASTDTTGDTDAGGDWELEYSTAGHADANSGDSGFNGETYFDSTLLDSYDHRLADPKEIVFINSSVKDPETLIEQLGPDVELVQLSSDNAFAEVTEYLRAYDGDVDAIHFLTHGNDGEFLLGRNTVIDADFIAGHGDDLAVWKNALAPDGDVLIYGCNVAAGERGMAFTADLAAALDSDVAVSTDRTGVGGDWDLEYSVGIIDVDGFTFDGYNYVWAQYTVKNLDDPYIASTQTINVNNLSLREALYLAAADTKTAVAALGADATDAQKQAILADGGTIVFADEATLTKNTTNAEHAASFTIYLQDSLTINSNVTIDGTITRPSPLPPVSVTLDGTQCKTVTSGVGTVLASDVTVEEGNAITLYNSIYYKTIKDTDASITLDYATTLALSRQTTVIGGGIWIIAGDTDTVLLTGNSTFADGTIFAGGTFTVDGNVVSLSDFPSQKLTDSGLNDEFGFWEIPGNLLCTTGSVLYFSKDTNEYNGVTAYGMWMTEGQTLKAGTVVGAGSIIDRTGIPVAVATTLTEDLTYSATYDYFISTLTINNTSGARAEYGLLLLNDLMLLEGTDLISGSQGDTKTELNLGSTLTLGYTTVSGDSIIVAKGFTADGEIFASADSILALGTHLRYGASGQTGELTETTYVYSGTVIYNEGATISAGTTLLGNVTLRTRLVYVEAEGAVVWETTSDNSANPDTTTDTEEEITNNPELPVGETTETGTINLADRVTEVVDNEGNITRTTVKTEIETTVVKVVTKSSDSDTSTSTSTSTSASDTTGDTTGDTTEDYGDVLTTTTTVVTRVTTIVDKSHTTGVTLDNMNFVNGWAQTSNYQIPATGIGGAIYLSSRSTLAILNTDYSSTNSGNRTEFRNNQAARDGGAIYVAGNAKLYIGIEGGGSSSPTYLSMGGGAYFFNNEAKNGSGGAIYNAGRLEVNHSVFVSNDASQSGGAVYSATPYIQFGLFPKGNSKVNDTNVYSYFSNNYAGGYGGAVFINAANLQTETIHFQLYSFTGNTAGHDGGAIYFTKGNLTSADTLQLEACHFIGNLAGFTSTGVNTGTGSGGAIYVTDCVGDITIATAISSTSSATNEMIFSTNVATGNGGAIALVGTQGDLKIDLVCFEQNYAMQDGGAIYIENSAGVSLSDVELRYNHAYDDGGAIYIDNPNNDSAKITLENCSVNHNFATGEGGGLHVESGVISILNSTFAFNGNSAGGNIGGAIYIASGSLAINFSTLAYNYGAGAAVYIDGPGTTTFSLNNSIVYNAIGDSFTSQIYVNPQAVCKATVSTTTNIYSHYYQDKTANANRFNLANGKTVNGVKYISESDADTLKIQQNLFLDTILAYKGSSRTTTLAIVSQDSIAYNQISAGSTKYDQRGNLRVDSKAWTWSGYTWVYNKTTGKYYCVAKGWVQGQKTKATVGAYEPIFYLEVSKTESTETPSDTDSSLLTGQSDKQFIDKAYSGGVTLADAAYWIDSYDGLLRLADYNAGLYLSTRDVNYLNNVNLMLVSRNRYFNAENSQTPNRDGAYANLVTLYQNADTAHTYTGFEYVAGVTLTASGSLQLNTIRGYDYTAEDYGNANYGYASDVYGNPIYQYSTASTAKVTWSTALYNPSDKLNVSAYFSGKLYTLSSTLKIATDTYGNYLRFSTTGSINFNAKDFAAGQVNEIAGAFTKGSTVYGSASNYLASSTTMVAGGSGADNMLLEVSIGGVYDRTYRSQEADVTITETTSTTAEDGTVTETTTTKNISDRIVVTGGGWSVGKYTVLAVSNLTITGGSKAGNGGGVSNSGSLTLNNMVISQNALNGVPSNNLLGAGIYNTGYLRIYDSSIADNTIVMTSSQTNTASYDGLGAGIYNSGKLWLERSEIYHNAITWTKYADTEIGQGGAGVYNAGTAYILNNTFTENLLTGPSFMLGGSAIANQSGQLYVYNNTIVKNQISLLPVVAAADKAVPGGLSALTVNGGTLHLANTIVTENTISNIGDYNLNFDVYANAGNVATSGNYDARYNVIGGWNGSFDWSAQVDTATQKALNYTGLHYYTTISGTGASFDYPEKNFGYIKSMLDYSDFGYHGAKTRTYRPKYGSALLDYDFYKEGYIIHDNLENGVLGYYGSDYIANLVKLGLITVYTDQRGVDRTRDSYGAIATTTMMGAYENISQLTVGSSADSLSFRSGFDYKLNQGLWMVDNLTLREALDIADDCTRIAFKDNWTASELDSSGKLTIKAVAEFRIGRYLVIDGAYTAAGDDAAHRVTIANASSKNATRFFYIKNYYVEDGVNSSAALYNLVLSGGKATVNSELVSGTMNSRSGGAIYCVGNLTLDNVAISGATAEGYGGGVYITGGLLNLFYSEIRDCTALLGGGVYAEANDLNNAGYRVLDVRYSSILGNTAANSAKTQGNGGGIFVRSGNASIEYSTVGNNKAVGNGGGIYVESDSFSIVNSTVANNTAGMNGGGIFFMANKTLAVDFTTIANNQSGFTVAGKAATGGTYYGGGIYLQIGNLSLTRSVVAQNFRGVAFDSYGYVAGNAVNDDLYVNNWANGANTFQYDVVGALSGNGANGGYIGTADNTIINVWSKEFYGALDTALTDNGGRTPTLHIFTRKTQADTLKKWTLDVGDELYDQTGLIDYKVLTGSRQWVGALEATEHKFYYVEQVEDDVVVNSGWTADYKTDAEGHYILMQPEDGLFSLQATEFHISSGTEVVDTDLVLGGADWVSTRTSKLYIAGTGSLTARGAIGGEVNVSGAGAFYIASASYSGLVLTVDNGTTTIGYTAAAAQTILALTDSGSDVTNYYNLVLGGGAAQTKEIVKTWNGDITIEGNLEVQDNTLFKVNAIKKTSSTAAQAGNLVFETGVNSNADAVGGRVLTAGNIKITGDQLRGIALDTAKKFSIGVESDSLQLLGNVTLGSANSLVTLPSGLVVSGANNRVRVNALGSPQIDLIGGELILDALKATITVPGSFFTNISSDAASRLEITTTGKLNVDASAGADFEGTLALNGKVAINSNLSMDAARLELGGTVTLNCSSISAANGIQITGSISLKNNLSLASDGDILIGGTLVDGVFTAGTKRLSGGGKGLTVTAGGIAGLGAISGVGGLSVSADAGIQLNGSISTKGTLALLSEAVLNSVYNSKGGLQTVKLTAGTSMQLESLTFGGDAENQSAVQLSANAKYASSIGNLAMSGTVTVVKGNFAYTGDAFAVGTFVNKGSIRFEDLALDAGAFTNSGTMTVTGDLIFRGTSSFTNTKILNAEIASSQDSAVVNLKSGTATVDEFTIGSFSAVSNGGTLGVTTMSITDSAQFASTKKLTVSTLEMNSGLFSAKGTTVITEVNLLNNANLSITGGKGTITRLSAEDSNLSNSGALTIASLAEFSGDGRVVNTKTLTLNTDLILGGEMIFENNSGTVRGLNVSLDVGTFYNRATLKLTGSFEGTELVNSGAMTVTGSITATAVANSKTIKAAGLDAVSLTNSGTVTLTGNTLNLSGALTNTGTISATAATAVIDGNVVTSKSLKLAALETAGRLDNEGTMTLTGALSIDTNDFNNRGTFTGNTVVISGDGSLTNTGKFKAVAVTMEDKGIVVNRKTFNADTLSMNGGDLDNSGTLTRFKAKQLTVELVESYFTNQRGGTLSNALLILGDGAEYLNSGKFTNVTVRQLNGFSAVRSASPAVSDALKTDVENALDELLAW